MFVCSLQQVHSAPEAKNTHGVGSGPALGAVDPCLGFACGTGTARTLPLGTHLDRWAASPGTSVGVLAMPGAHTSLDGTGMDFPEQEKGLSDQARQMLGTGLRWGQVVFEGLCRAETRQVPENCCCVCQNGSIFAWGRSGTSCRAVTAHALPCHMHLALAGMHTLPPVICAKGQGRVMGCIWGSTFGGSCPSGLGQWYLGPY